MAVPSCERLAWLCAELAAGNAFSPELLRQWEREARAEQAGDPALRRSFATADMLDTLGWVDATLNWADESEAEMLEHVPSLREQVRATIAKAESAQ